MKCPHCRNAIDPREAVMDENWRAIILLLPVFGRHGHLVWEYVEKFGVTPVMIKATKIRRLLEELAKLFETHEFFFQKKRYEVSEKGIVEGLLKVVSKNFSMPLENHNYLKKVLIGTAEGEQRGEVDKREAYLRRREAGEGRDERRVTSDERRVEGLAAGIGRPMP